jgi:hypothetical protein
MTGTPPNGTGKLSLREMMTLKYLKANTRVEYYPLARERVMNDAISWSELAELTHATQVERFNFCMCEDLEPHEYPYPDCVKELV